MKKILKSALDLIGNTPIIKLHKIVPENSAEVWLKYKAVNPTGSYKDRMAKSVLGNALERGDLSQGDKVIAEGLSKVRPNMKIKPIIKTE